MRWDWQLIRLPEPEATEKMMSLTGQGWEVVSHCIFMEVRPNPKKVLGAGESPVVAAMVMSVVLRKPAIGPGQGRASSL